MAHRNLFRSNCFQMVSPSSSSVSTTSLASFSAFVEANLGAAHSSAEGKPTFSGESFMKIRAKAPAPKAMTPGPSIPARQLYRAAKPPANRGIRNPPMLWDAFQLLHHFPRLLAGNQFTSILLQGVAPQPWNRPFKSQIKVKMGTVLAVEKAMFRTPVHMRPKEKIKTGEPSKSDKTPERNFEFMYARGNKELIVPNCTMLKPKSLRIARPTYVNESRVK